MRPEVRTPTTDKIGDFRYYFSCESGHYAVLSQQEFDQWRVYEGRRRKTSV